MISAREQEAYDEGHRHGYEFAQREMDMIKRQRPLTREQRNAILAHFWNKQISVEDVIDAVEEMHGIE